MLIKYFKNILSHRELILNLAVKDFKVRYKSAILGFSWALLNPLLMMVILSVVFMLILKVQIDKFPIFLLTALIPWYFLNSSLSMATTSIVDNSSLIKKVSFPREIVPISVMLSNLFNFLLSVIVLFIFMVTFRIKFSALILFLPLAIILQCILVLGLSLISATLHTFYRDTRYIIEVLLLCGFYLTPIFYTLDMVPKSLQHIYMLNPMVGMVAIYRGLLFYGNLPQLTVIIYTTVVSFLVFTLGLVVFRKYERLFADYV